MNLRKWTGLTLIISGALTIFSILNGIWNWVAVPPLTALTTLMTFSFAFLHAGQREGWRRALVFLLVVFIVSLSFESIGVATGAIYGPYEYTGKLGPKVFGLVPLLIPVAWFMMMYPALVIAEEVVPGALLSPGSRRLAVAAVGGVIMTAWDLAMDPLMVAGGHWIWKVDGAYFGIPIQNFWGWWLTSLCSLFVYLFLIEAIPALRRIQQSTVPESWAVIGYSIIGGSSIIVSFIHDLSGPALVGIFAMFPWVILGYFRLAALQKG